MKSINEQKNKLMEVLSSDLNTWQPLPMDHLLKKHGIRHTPTLILFAGWTVLLFISISFVLYFIPQGGSFTQNFGQISTFAVFYPPLLFSTLLIFWFGFEWGFIPAYLSTFLIALSSGMQIGSSLLFGFALVFGLAIYALVLNSIQIPYNLSSVVSLSVYVSISFIASMASSLGAIIWCNYHNFPIDQTLIFWKGWWTGSFLQMILIIAPILYFFSPAVEHFKKKYFVLNNRRDVSISWVYCAILSVVAVICIFVWTTNLIGQLRIEKVLANSPGLSKTTIISATQTFELTTWIAIGITVIAGLAGINLVSRWNKEKQSLLGEIHHRVKNNLALITGLLELQLDQTKSKRTKRQLKECVSRIYSMALIHENIYQMEQFVDIKLDTFLRSKVNHIQHLHEDEDTDIEVTMNVQRIYLPLEKAVPFGLLLNELLNNAYNHAFNDNQGTIHIEIEQQESTIHLRFGDNGQGLPEDLDMKQPSTLGMTLVNKLVAQINGDYDIETSPEDGTVYQIYFKPKQHDFNSNLPPTGTYN
jgi:two-component sensor histidine kinase